MVGGAAKKSEQVASLALNLKLPDFLQILSCIRSSPVGFFNTVIEITSVKKSLPESPHTRTVGNEMEKQQTLLPLLIGSRIESQLLYISLTCLRLRTSDSGCL